MSWDRDEGFLRRPRDVYILHKNRHTRALTLCQEETDTAVCSAHHCSCWTHILTLRSPSYRTYSPAFPKSRGLRVAWHMVGGQTPEQRWEGEGTSSYHLLLAGRSMVTQKEATPSSCLRSGSGGEKHLAGDYILIRGAGRGPAPGDALLLAVSVGRCQIWAQQPVGISQGQLICPLRAGAPGPLHVLKPLPPPPKPTENSSSLRRPPAGPGRGAGSVWTPRNMPTTPAVTPLLPEACLGVCSRLPHSGIWTPLYNLSKGRRTPISPPERQLGHR